MFLQLTLPVLLHLLLRVCLGGSVTGFSFLWKLRFWCRLGVVWRWLRAGAPIGTGASVSVTVPVLVRIHILFARKEFVEQLLVIP